MGAEDENYESGGLTLFLTLFSFFKTYSVSEKGVDYGKHY